MYLFLIISANIAINHILLKTRTSISLTKLTSEDTAFGRITQNNGHIAFKVIQGHSRSPIMVPFEGWRATSY